VFRAHLSSTLLRLCLALRCQCVFACVRVCVKNKNFFFSCIYLHASRFSDFYTREQPMCNQKLPFCPLVCLYGFFFSYIHINIFFFYPPPDHTHKAASYLRSWCFFNFNFFSFYRKYSYDSAFLSSFPLFFLFKFLYNNNYLSSKVEKRQKEGYIYKWIYINYSKAPAR
jgi:hypothetical protein